MSVKKPLLETRPTTCTGEKAFTIWNIPIWLRAGFKAACARKGVSMRQAIMDFMKSFIDA